MDWLTLIQQARQGDKQSRDTIIEEYCKEIFKQRV